MLSTSLVAFHLQVLFTTIISYDNGDLSPIAVGWLFTCIGPKMAQFNWDAFDGEHQFMLLVNTSS